MICVGSDRNEVKTLVIDGGHRLIACRTVSQGPTSSFATRDLVAKVDVGPRLTVQHFHSHPIFVDDFPVLLPLVLHQPFGSLTIRCNAAMTLSGFTLVKLNSPAISNYDLSSGPNFRTCTMYQWTNFEAKQLGRRSTTISDYLLCFKLHWQASRFGKGKVQHLRYPSLPARFLLDCPFGLLLLKLVFSIYARCSFCWIFSSIQA